VKAILERVHQTIMGMLRTADIDMADTISESDLEDFLTNAAWAVRSTYHTVLKASPGEAFFGRDIKRRPTSTVNHRGWLYNSVS
jgi:hypothetical protein